MRIRHKYQLKRDKTSMSLAKSDVDKIYSSELLHWMETVINWQDWCDWCVYLNETVRLINELMITQHPFTTTGSHCGVAACMSSNHITYQHEFHHAFFTNIVHEGWAKKPQRYAENTLRTFKMCSTRLFVYVTQGQTSSSRGEIL